MRPMSRWWSRASSLNAKFVLANLCLHFAQQNYKFETNEKQNSKHEIRNSKQKEKTQNINFKTFNNAREVLIGRFWILRIEILKLFRISIFGFRILIRGRLGLPAPAPPRRGYAPEGRAYPPGRSPYGVEASPEGAKNFVEVVLLNILSVRI